MPSTSPTARTSENGKKIGKDSGESARSGLTVVGVALVDVEMLEAFMEDFDNAASRVAVHDFAQKANSSTEGILPPRPPPSAAAS